MRTYAADVATQLIYWRADVNHINQDQVTPLLRAIQTDHLKIFEVLLKENAGIPAKPSDVQHDAISSARAVLLKSCEKYNATKIKMYLQSLGPEESRNAWVVPGSQSAQPTSARQVVQPTLASHSAKPMTAKKGVVLDPTMLGEHLIQIKKNIVGWDSNPGYSNDANTPGSSAGASMSGFSADASKTGFSADASKTGFSADASKTGFSTAASNNFLTGFTLFAKAGNHTFSGTARLRGFAGLFFGLWSLFIVVAGLEDYLLHATTGVEGMWACRADVDHNVDVDVRRYRTFVLLDVFVFVAKQRL